jgi:phage/plasmid-associated DNA primase
MIKKISSGGDAIVGRGHGENEEEFITHFLSFVFANDLPKIKPYDDAVNNRTKVFSYKKTFVDNPSNEYELKMDRDIEKEILTKRFQSMFIELLIREYKEYMENGCEDIEPLEASVSKTEWIEEEQNYIDMFKNEFEITNDSKDWVESSVIADWLINKKLGITMTKFGFEMNKYIKINGLDNVFSKDKKISGKVKKVWYGIKNVSDDDESNCFFNNKK